MNVFFPTKNRVTRNLIPLRKNHLLFFYLVFEISSFIDPCVNTPFSSQLMKKAVDAIEVVAIYWLLDDKECFI